MNSIIEAKGLTKKYGEKIVLNNIDISVQEGEIFGILGVNGAGKTTTIECILGTKKAESGEISILGINPKKDRKKLFEQIGVQFQEANYPDKIKVSELCEETASLYKHTNDYKVLLKEFGLADKENSFVADLSGGQKQKLFIILALIPKPKIMFLDELTTGLDPRARRNVWQSLLELKNKGMTIVLTSHFMDEVEKLCDKIVILKNGEIVFRGTVKEAIESSPYDNFEDTYLWYSEEAENNESI